MISVVPYGLPMLDVFARATAGSGDTFALPADAVVLVLVPTHSGTVTLLTLDLEISPDAGALSPTWEKIITGKALASVPAVCDVEGYGGLHCRLTSTGFTLGTAVITSVGAKCSKSQ